MAIYFSSDFHFNHNKEFVWKARGYSSVEEMNNVIIDKFNSLISPEDDAYILGDLCLGGADNLDKSKECIENLNGKIHIILGNHCTNNRIKMYKQCKNVEEVIGYAYMLKYNKYHFYLSHYPTLTSNLDDDKPLKARVISLCGHSHATDRWADWDKGLIYHVEVDAHNCYPVLLDDIIEEIKIKYKE